MKIRETETTLRIDGVPALHWLLAALFGFGGAAFFLGPLGLFRNADDFAWPLRVLVSTMGAIGVGTGLWVLSESPRMRLVVDRGAATLRLDHWGLRGRATRAWPLAEARGVRLVEDRDDEGDEVFRIEILFEGEPVLVSPVWHHGREAVTPVARRLADALGVELSDATPR